MVEMSLLHKQHGSSKPNKMHQTRYYKKI